MTMNPPDLPLFGADLVEGGAGGVRYAAWSPASVFMEVEIEPGESGVRRLLPMKRGEHGQFWAIDPDGKAGDRYRYRPNGGGPFPDPGSRAQAESVHGASVVVDPRLYRWEDAGWSRPAFRELVIYELHVGTFTPEGSFRAAIEKLAHLRALGVNAIELMPIGDFPGSRNWGYDGVLLYAPARAYGSPDDLRALVDAAHRHGIAVILDVVYNHFGPDGNYLGAYSPSFFNEDRHTPWGAAINFDGREAALVRPFFIRNPVYWMEEFHIDGFRLDATHAIADRSEPSILKEIVAAIHARGGYAIAEDERNDAGLIAPAGEGGCGFDGVWADDFHHGLRVSQTGQKEGYFGDFEGTPEELAETLRHGWLYRGRMSKTKKRPRGTECRHLPASRFIHCISNHDQTGNRAFGERFHALITPAGYRAASALLCLSPYTPMLFMGQEWAASTPFLFFTDHNEQLGPLVTEGRRREFAGFSAFGDPLHPVKIPDPQEMGTFRGSKLDWDEIARPPHAGLLALYAECLRLRRRVLPESREQWKAGLLAFGPVAIRLRNGGETWLLVVNLSGNSAGGLRAEELAALEAGEEWRLMFSSEEERFGGGGDGSFDEERQWCRFSGPETLLLRKGMSPA